MSFFKKTISIFTIVSFLSINHYRAGENKPLPFLKNFTGLLSLTKLDTNQAKANATWNNTTELIVSEEGLKNIQKNARIEIGLLISMFVILAAAIFGPLGMWFEKRKAKASLKKENNIPQAINSNETEQN